MIRERLLLEQKRLDAQISMLQKKLAAYPPGHLLCSNNKGYFKWYQSDGHKRVYIPKSNESLAKQLAKKKYLTLSLEDLLTEKKALELAIKHLSHSPGKAELFLSQSSEAKRLLSAESKEIPAWAPDSYQTNQSHPEQLIHKTISGRMVRSKSEAMIDYFLYLYNIPSLYECALRLGENTVYPDFTIRHPSTGATYYWEHFGMMDSRSYAENVYIKLNMYSLYGIIPSIQLITTYETKDHPLDMATIEDTIKKHFL